jgi:uncharacterized protein
MSGCVLWNQSRGTVAARELLLADTPRTRLFGLLGRPSLSPGEALLLQPSSGVHTCFMRFPIDVVALDRAHRVIGIWEAVGPWRIRGVSLRTHAVLELGAGEAARSGIGVGDTLLVKGAKISRKDRRTVHAPEAGAPGEAAAPSPRQTA